MPSSKYARVEVERRFLLAGVPEGAEVLAVHEIDDRYLDGTRLRLRRMAQVGGATQLKLTQKVARRRRHGRQGELTTLYLSEAEHAALARMPAAALSKSRLSIVPYGVDVFHGELAGSSSPRSSSPPRGGGGVGAGRVLPRRGHGRPALHRRRARARDRRAGPRVGARVRGRARLGR